MLLIAGLPATARAQVQSTFAGYKTKFWSGSDGALLNESYPITQDAEGYIWLGSPSGPLRFDGAQFRLLRLGGDQQKLPRAEIVSLCFATDGSLWVGFSNAGIRRISNGVVTDYDRVGRDQDFAGYVSFIVQSRNGAIWAGGTAGLRRFRNEAWEQLGSRNGLPDSGVRGLYEDRQGRLWVSTAVGIFRQAQNSDTFQLVERTAYLVQAFSEDPTGTMWIADPVAGARVVPSSGTVDQFRLPGQASGFRLLHDRKGDLWIGTSGQGLFRVGRDSVTGHISIEHFGEREGIVNPVIWSLFEDRAGNIWAGVPGGLYQFSLSKVPYEVERRFFGQLVTAVTSDANGAVWLATADDLIRISGAQSTRYRMPFDPSRDPSTTLHVGADGTVWVARNRQLAKLGGGQLALLDVPVGPTQIVGLATDRDGYLWMCDRRGVFRLKDRQIEAMTAIGHHQCSAIQADRSGRVWMTFTSRSPLGDIAVYDRGQLRWYPVGDGVTGRGILEDHSGNIWVRSRHNLSRLKDDAFVSLDEQARLPRAVLGAKLLEDQLGFLWVSIGAGFARLNRAELELALTDRSRRVNFESVELTHMWAPIGQPTMTLTKDGKIWVVSGNGVTVFDTKSVTPPAPPVVRIENLVVNGQEVRELKRLEVGPLVSSLSIEYGALSLVDSERIRFRYKLEGLETDWVDAQARRQAFYTNLQPGSYRFVAMANNGDDTWSAPAASLAFRIRPALYQMTWFYPALMLSVVAAVLAAWHVRVRQLAKRSEMVLAERSRIARAIHDTLLQDLAGSALRLGAIAVRARLTPESVEEALGAERRRLEQLVRDTGRSIKALRSTLLEGGALSDAIQEVGGQLADAHAVRFTLKVKNAPIACKPWIEEHLLHIAHEAIANAARHAQAANIRVALAFESKSLSLTVSDDGRGFDPDAVGNMDNSHLGLLIMRERTAMIGGRCEVDSSQRGTVVTIVVPLTAQAIDTSSEVQHHWA